MRTFMLCFLGLLNLFTVSCQAQEKDKQVIQQDSTTKEEIVDFSNFTIKEVLSVINKSGQQESMLRPNIQTKQNIFSNRFIDFTKYNIVEEFEKEADKYLEKLVIIQTEKVVNNIEIRFYFSGLNVLSVIKIKDTKVFRFVESCVYDKRDLSEGDVSAFFDRGYIICFKPDSLCFCIDYNNLGAVPPTFPAANIIAIKKLNYINLNPEAILYFDQGKLIKNLDCVYQDSTSKHPHLFQHYKEKHLNDDFLLQDDTKVADILAMFNAENHMGNLFIDKSLLTDDTWKEKKYVSIWGVNIGTNHNALDDIIKLPEK